MQIHYHSFPKATGKNNFANIILPWSSFAASEIWCTEFSAKCLAPSWFSSTKGELGLIAVISHGSISEELAIWSIISITWSWGFSEDMFRLNSDILAGAWISSVMIKVVSRCFLADLYPVAIKNRTIIAIFKPIVLCRCVYVLNKELLKNQQASLPFKLLQPK